MAITKNAIMMAAIELLQEGGLEALSMRALAARLDIKAASLYWHIKGKGELFTMIAEYLCTQIAPAWDLQHPSKYLRDFYHQLRGCLLTVRDGTKVFAEASPYTDFQAAIVEDTLACLREMGVSEKMRPAAAQMLLNYVVSSVADEQRRPENADEYFSYGLDVLLYGLAGI